MSIENHTFCWNGIVTTDLEATLAFFPEVLGWNTVEVEMGGDPMSMFAIGDKSFAHVRPPQMETEPAWWNNYLRVDDVDAAVARAVEAGGTVLVPATDIPPGRFATVTTKSGAAFSFFREAAEDDDGAAGAAIHWVDLHSRDITSDLDFLHALGLPTQSMPMPQGDYHLLNPEGPTRGGAMQGAHPEAPSMWLAWAEVDDVDDALTRVSNHGGEIVGPAWDAPGVGRLAICRDPGGVVFGVITPAAQG